VNFFVAASRVALTIFFCYNSICNRDFCQLQVKLQLETFPGLQLIYFSWKLGYIKVVNKI
jgi:hypothetical protein